MTDEQQAKAARLRERARTEHARADQWTRQAREALGFANSCRESARVLELEADAIERARKS